ncbi:ML5 [Symbiodinium natans]|uniref:ML5 protein n=1 Tax=Symbiodinium natans TaxID=878477 RepID=A0A812LZZ6_9DINO|nr:ML5 [Symbiodinium natans]
MCVFGWGPSSNVFDVMDLLQVLGLSPVVNFAYMPLHWRSDTSFGEVFLNAVTPEAALELWGILDGMQFEGESECLTVRWATKVQGLDALIQKYRNSSAMHPSVPVKAKPHLFDDGRCSRFPDPTRKLAKPRRHA